MKATFPLIGERTGIYMPLFWLDRYPQYLTWGQELLCVIAPAFDEVLVVSDRTLSAPPQETTCWVALDGPVKLWRYFREAVIGFESMDVGAFFYTGSDDIHSLNGVQALVDACVSDCDVAFADYSPTESRGPVFPFVPKYSFSFTDSEHIPFCMQQYPESSCYRTAVFAEFPPKDERMFIASSMRQAMEADKMPVGRKVPEGAFYYYKHTQGQNDRSFQLEV